MATEKKSYSKLSLMSKVVQLRWKRQEKEEFYC